MDNAALRCGLLKEHPSSKHGLSLLPISYRSRKFQSPSKTVQLVPLLLAAPTRWWGTFAQDTTYFPCGERSILNWPGNSLPMAAFHSARRCCSGCWGRKGIHGLSQLQTMHAPSLTYQERCAHWHNTGKTVHWSVIVSFSRQRHTNLDSAVKRETQWKDFPRSDWPVVMSMKYFLFLFSFPFPSFSSLFFSREDSTM